MGFFSGLRDRWNDGSLLNSLQMAGATAQGDYASASRIGEAYQDRRALAETAAATESRRLDAEKRVAREHDAVYSGLRQRGVPDAEARALSLSTQGASVLGSYNNQQTPDAAARLLSAYGYTNPNQPGYREAEQAARSFGMGQPVTDSEGRASMATPTIVPAHEYAAQDAPPPPPVLGTGIDYATARSIMLEQGASALAASNNGNTVVRVSTPTEAMSLPSGTRWIAIDENGLERTGTRP